MKTLNRILIAATIFLLCGCSFGDPKPQSEDIAALRAIVNLPMEVKSARWEIFGTPDDSGWVPGPTDFHTLIAELEQEQDWFSSLKEPAREIFIVPEAARPWLTREFRDLLNRNKNSTAILSSRANCRKYVTTVTKSGRELVGVACNSSGKILVYLPLAPQVHE
ncbi:hypothetical protein [Pseudoduganella sp. R-34]|uniref:hypothetical protein n=1 Tax=unclassified Pseudoduganella TaxID=2637179 RepID=UPI003CE6D416